MITDFIFTSERLGFRNWSNADLAGFAELNADPEVMRHFPKILSREESKDFIESMQKQYYKNGFTYFAVEVLASGDFIGFIGLASKDFSSPYTPAIDIGWRLKQSAWGHGYATEGALRCIEYAFKSLNIKQLISVCPKTNLKSEHMMQKIGMQKLGEFKHPQLKAYPELEVCVCYGIKKEEHNENLNV